MTRKRLTGISLCFAMCFAIITVSCEKKSNEETKETIKIGVLAPLTGSLDYFGIGQKNAVKLAAAEIGKVFDKEIEFILADSESNPDVASVAAQSLVDQGVVAILGATASSVTMTVAKEVTIPKNLLLISAASTSPAITNMDDKNLVFRTAPSDAGEGSVAAGYVYNDLKAKSVGILYIDNAFGVGLAETFKAKFESLAGAGSVLNYVAYPEMTDTEIAAYDFKDKIDTLFTGQPDLIYLITYFTDGGKITKTIGANIDLSFGPVFLGCNGHQGQSLIDNGDALVTEGMYGLGPSAPQNNANYAAYSKKYKTAYGVTPEVMSQNFYDAIYLLLYAMLEAGSTVSSEIAAKLASVSETGDVININMFEDAKAKIKAGTDINYEGASGAVSFDANGDMKSGTYEVWKIVNGKFTTLEYQEFEF